MYFSNGCKSERIGRMNVKTNPITNSFLTASLQPAKAVIFRCTPSIFGFQSKAWMFLYSVWLQPIKEYASGRHWIHGISQSKQIVITYISRIASCWGRCKLHRESPLNRSRMFAIHTFWRWNEISSWLSIQMQHVKSVPLIQLCKVIPRSWWFSIIWIEWARALDNFPPLVI